MMNVDKNIILKVTNELCCLHYLFSTITLTEQNWLSSSFLLIIVGTQYKNIEVSDAFYMIPVVSAFYVP